MRVILSFGVMALFIWAGSHAEYDTKYDNIDVEKIAADKERFTRFVACLLDRGECTVPAATFKGRLEDMLKTNCGQCNDKQRQLVITTIKFLRLEHSAEFDEIIEKYKGKGSPLLTATA